MVTSDPDLDIPSVLEALACRTRNLSWASRGSCDFDSDGFDDSCDSDDNSAAAAGDNFELSGLACFEDPS